MLHCILILCLITGAFANLRAPKDSGIIVNPFYNPKDDKYDTKKSNQNEFAPPTHQQLAETLNLRSVINNAVRSNTYAVGGSGSSIARPKVPFFSMFGNWLGSQSNKDVGSTKADVMLGTEKVVPETNFGTTIPDNLTNNAAGEIKSNLIDSVIMSNLESKPFRIMQKKVQREKLELISIEEDVNFPHGHNIRAWITIETKANENNALVGVGNSSVVLIADKNGRYEIVDKLDLKTTILCFTNYQLWNHTSKSFHSIVIVEIVNQLLFISTGDDLTGFVIIWQWTMHSRLDSLFYFKHESSDMMLMINSPVGHVNDISADIYRFDLQTRNTWLIQKIPLNNPCKSVAVINTHRELILCFAQNNTVELYKIDQNANSPAFKYYSSIEAKNVQTVSGFQMGGFSYLATTGLDPKIFRYHRGSFVAQAILSRRWGLVEIIFPIPARTYRDDLILLVQHRITMGTHTVTVVEALIWDGESFDVSLSVPCRIGDEIMDFGMTCLLDYERDIGIDGLSILQNGNSISLIVPRVEAPSSMFKLKFQLTSSDSPNSEVVKDFEILAKYTEETSTYQNDIMYQATDALARGLSNNGNRNDVSAAWNLTSVTADSLIINDGAMWKIDKIYFGNEEWSEADLNIKVMDMMGILQELKSSVDLLEKEFVENNFAELEPESPVHITQPPPMNGKFDINTLRTIKGGRRQKRTGVSDDRMKVNELNVKKINVDYINDIPIEDVVFTQNGVLNSVNSLIVEGSVNVLNEVQVAAGERMETVGGSIDDRHLLEKLPADNIHITGDVFVDSINGVLWEDFVHQIVMRNLPNLIHELTVNGDIVAKENIEVDFLNQMAFPRDFLWTHDTDISIVAGQKVFKGTLTADSVDTSGTVDGISTQETISLVEIQHIRGLTTFVQLEVTEGLDVNGTINGKHLADFKPNLSLLESNVISSDCLFQNLQVQGPISITNDCNGATLDDILSDVVYKSHPKSTITSFKTFGSVESIVELTSNLINNVPVDHYMTTDTMQDIQFDRFIGNVMMRELNTNLFDFINVTELDRNSIKLTGEQFTEAELIFDSDEINIDVDTVEIQTSFNGLSKNDLISVDESLDISGNVVVNTAIIKDLVIRGEVNGNGMLNGVSLSEFDTFRFSRTRAQDITSTYFVENVAIDNEIDSEYVNGVDIAVLRQHINHITNLPEFLSSTDVKINNLIVDGNLLVRTINGHDFDSIKDNAVWLNQPNIVIGELQFLDTFEIGQGVIVNNLNNEIFENFIDGLVLKTDEHAEFTGRKIFQNEFHVDQDIQVDSLNGISTTNIWTKGATAHTTGQVHIIGNLFVENVNLHGFVNSVYWREIEDNYHFDAERRAHVLTNNVRFTSPTNINDLYIQHGLNTVENITDYLSHIIRKNHAGIVSGKKQFQSNVIFMDHLQTANLDTVDIPTLFDNVVINDVNQKIIIVGDIAFEDDVTASHIHVSGNILTSTIMDCSLSEWNENALVINAPVKIFQHLLFPVGTFQAGNIEVESLNGNAMATILTLNSDQSFGHSLLSEFVSLSEINVGGVVNGYNMKAILDNSVLVTGDNYITAPTTLQSARVLNVLQTVGTINGKNFNNIATLHEDLHLYGPLSFRSIKARNLITKDTISGIDFDYWYANALWKSQRENQIISGIWTVSEGIFHSSVKGNALLNGIPIQNLAEQINAHQSNVRNNLEMFNRDYVENCHRLQHLIQKTQTVPYFLTHFEEAFSLRVQSVLNSVHFFESNGQNYVVMNLACLTVLHVWNRDAENYDKIVETETGNVDSWLDMTDETNSVHLISNTEEERSNCPTSGLNIWKFDGNSLAHVSKITDPEKFSSLHRSKVHPQRFLAMARDDGIVSAFDLQSNLIEQWHLPLNDQKFRFVPENANLGIALSNGKQLSSLSYTTSTDSRKGRSISPFALSDSMEIKRAVRCPYLEEKLGNATAKCKLWRQSKLNALSNIGPYKYLDPITQSRLLKDFNISNIQLGSPLFKPNLIPTENGSLKSSNVTRIPSTNGPQSSTVSSTSIISTSDPVTSAASKQVGMSLNSTARDTFGDIEKATTDLADNIVDSLIDLDARDEDIDFDDSFIGSSSKSQSKVESKPMFTSTNKNNSQPTSSRDMLGDIKAQTTKYTDKATSDEDPVASTTSKQVEKPVNSTSRDVFGDIAKATTDLADNVIDSLIEVDATDEDVDFDDSLIGTASNGQSNVESKAMPNSTDRSKTQSTSSRDMFGDIEAKTVKFADKVMNVFENIKDTAKESQAKFHNMFPVNPTRNGQYRRTEGSSDDQKNKNLPKIPKVVYTTNDTDLHVTQSPYTLGTDGTINGWATDTSTPESPEISTTTTDGTTTHFSYEEVGEMEPKISKEIFSEGIATAENPNFPNHSAEEIVGITVGENKKHLVAVSSLREHTIQGKHDLIRIYEDIIEGNLFQTLICHRPRSLSVFNMRDETILAFIENDADVQIFVYRGIEGFVKFTSFELPSYVSKLTTIHLPIHNAFGCAKTYLAVTMKKEIRFIEAKACGYCGVNAELRCD